MLKFFLLLLFLYLFSAYILRWFFISNSEDYLKQHGERTLFTDFFSRLWNTLYLFFLEYCSYLAAVILLTADYIYHFITAFTGPGKTPLIVSGGKPPVLLIHGYMMRGWTLSYLKMRLQKDGWDNVCTWSYSPPFKNIPYYAEQLKNKVDEILKETSQSEIILICHSMGGLLARQYINHLGGELHVKKLVTLGTPHEGTRLWSFTYSPCGLDMRPGSDFLKNLNDLPESAKTLSIFSSFDEIILPYQSSELKGNNAHNKEFDGLGHMRLIYSPEVYEEIHSFLADL